jgi:hypothetical protein
MPLRESKRRRETKGAKPGNPERTVEQPINKAQGQRPSPGRTHTRINAFITSMGRRNQAKRDAR